MVAFSLFRGLILREKIQDGCPRLSGVAVGVPLKCQK